MVRTFADGIAFVRSPAGRAVECINPKTGGGLCKQRVREAFLVDSNGSGSAAQSWEWAPDKHRDTNPKHAPAYSFGWMTGGGMGSGHVVVNLGGGTVLTPGGPADKHHWYETTAAALLRGWPNLRWVGWTRSIDGKYPALPVIEPAKPAPKRPKTSPKRWASFMHLALYYVNDSLRAVRRAARRKDHAIDLNWHLTKDLVWVNTHWATPLEHGFRWDKTATRGMRRLPKNTRIQDMTWRQVHHLVSKVGGYRINRAERILALADKLGVRVEFEDKGGGGRRRLAYQRLAAIPAVQRLQARGLFQVKTLTQIPGAANRLRAAKASGFTTIVSTTNAKSKRLSLTKFGPVADYVRGKVTWAA